MFWKALYHNLIILVDYLYFPKRTYVPLLTDKNQQKVILEIVNPFIARILGNTWFDIGSLDPPACGGENFRPADFGVHICLWVFKECSCIICFLFCLLNFFLSDILRPWLFLTFIPLNHSLFLLYVQADLGAVGNYHASHSSLITQLNFRAKGTLSLTDSSQLSLI